MLDTWEFPLKKCGLESRQCIHCSPTINPDGQELREMLPDLEPEGFDLLLKMLCVAPGRRITAKAALKHPYFNA
ncbi:UNVERIFIED_CONTAM: Cyclin-dependent kinase [Sesamum angustifolium]|uniref:Cyclin-dependent kinase n=1 Tax=Sesamum angustifolium TaxID=2727405 RepID=A0AAW2RJ98_9LAMI